MSYYLGTAAECNIILERLGSGYRVQPNTQMTPGIIAILDAIPGYIERMVEERIASGSGSRVFETREFDKTLGIVRIERWPEGIELWVGGERVWKSAK